MAAVRAPTAAPPAEPVRGGSAGMAAGTPRVSLLNRLQKALFPQEHSSSSGRVRPNPAVALASVHASKMRDDAMLMFAAILATALAGLMKAPWWVIFVGFGVLSGVTAWERRRLHPRFAVIGSPEILNMASWTSASQCLIAACASFGWGSLMRFAFFG